MKFIKFKLKEGDMIKVDFIVDLINYDDQQIHHVMLVTDIKNNTAYTFNGKPQSIVCLYDIENNTKYEIDISCQYVNNKSTYRFYKNGDINWYLHGNIISNKI